MNENKELLNKLSVIFTLNHLRDLIYKRNGKNEENVLSFYGINLDFDLEAELQKIIKKEDITKNEYINALKKVLSNSAFKELESLYLSFCYKVGLNIDAFELTEEDDELNAPEYEKIKAYLTQKGVKRFEKIIEDYQEYKFILLENIKRILEDKNQIAEILRTDINTLEETLKDNMQSKTDLTKNQALAIQECINKNISIPTKEEQNNFTFNKLLLEYDEALELISFITLNSKKNKYLKATDLFLTKTFFNTINGRMILLDAFKMELTQSDKLIKSLKEKFSLLLEELKDKKSEFYLFNEEIKILQSEVKKNYQIAIQDKPLETFEMLEAYYHNENWITANQNVIIEEKGANLYTRLANIKCYTPLTFNNYEEKPVLLHEIKTPKNEFKLKAIKDLIQRKITDKSADYNEEANLLTLSAEELEEVTDLKDKRDSQKILNNLMYLIENTKIEYVTIQNNIEILSSFSYFEIKETITQNKKIICYVVELHDYFKLQFKNNTLGFLSTFKHLTAEQRFIERRIGELKNRKIEENKNNFSFTADEVYEETLTHNLASKTHANRDMKKKINAIMKYAEVNEFYTIGQAEENKPIFNAEVKEQTEAPVLTKNEQREIKPYTKAEIKEIVKELYPDASAENCEAIYKILRQNNKLSLELIHLQNEIKETYQILIETSKHKEVKPRSKKQARTREDFINIAKENNININYALNCYAYMKSKENLKLTDTELLTNIKKFIDSKYMQTQAYCLQNNFDFEKAKEIITKAFNKKINDLSEDEFIKALNIVKNKMQAMERIRLQEEQLEEELNNLTPEEQAKRLKAIKNFWNN